MSGLSKIQASTAPRPLRPQAAGGPAGGDRLPTPYTADADPGVNSPERAYQIAMAWDPANPHGMTGVDANKAITASYAWLDGRMSRYLGDPPAANWTTFGKYASREAGSNIQRFEALQGMVHDNSLKRALNYALGLLHDFIGHRDSLSRQALLMSKVSDTPEQYDHNVKLMHDTLVNGNADIIHDIGPAFQTFLSAEEHGQDGLSALKAAGYGADKDPHGFLLKAFEGYQQARVISQRLKTEQLSSADRSALEAQRRDLVFQANLSIGIQEQMYSLQTKRTFANSEVQHLMKTFTPSMTLSDAANRMPLLPNGGNWANFPQRMGFKEVFQADTPGAMLIPDLKGRPHYFIVNPDAKARQGTIYEYFKANMGEDLSRKLITSKPEDYPTFYDGTMGRLKSTWNWLKGKLGLGASPASQPIPLAP